jgi:hypothetical protein
MIIFCVFSDISNAMCPKLNDFILIWCEDTTEGYLGEIRECRCTNNCFNVTIQCDELNKYWKYITKSPCVCYSKYEKTKILFIRILCVVLM